MLPCSIAANRSVWRLLAAIAEAHPERTHENMYKKKPLHVTEAVIKKASYGTRTRDIQLGKLALYQLSQTRLA